MATKDIGFRKLDILVYMIPRMVLCTNKTNKDLPSIIFCVYSVTVLDSRIVACVANQRKDVVIRLLIGIKMKTWSAYATCVGRDISIVQGIDIRMGVIVTN